VVPLLKGLILIRARFREPKGPFHLDFAGESAIRLFDGAPVYFGDLAKPDSSAHISGLIGPVAVMRISSA